MKLNKLRSIANNAVRTSSSDDKGYMLDPFDHFTPEFEIEIDLISGKFTPEREGDDVERFYSSIIKWFHEVLPKEGIPISVIDEAIIKITPKEKKCIIKAKGREFTSQIKYK